MAGANVQRKSDLVLAFFTGECIKWWIIVPMHGRNLIAQEYQVLRRKKKKLRQFGEPSLTGKVLKGASRDRRSKRVVLKPGFRLNRAPYEDLGCIYYSKVASIPFSESLFTLH